MKSITLLTLVLSTSFALSAHAAPAASCDSPRTTRYLSSLGARDFDTLVDGYSGDATTSSFTSRLIRNIQKASGALNSVPLLHCLHAIKIALDGTWMQSYLPGLAAANSGPNLEKEGFINLLCHPDQEQLFPSPYEAPHGAILVYSGGAYGHIEARLKTDRIDGFISDYFCSTSRTGRAANGRYGHPTANECDPKLAKESRQLTGIFIHR